MKWILFIVSLLLNWMVSDGQPTLQFYQHSYKVKNITDADILTTTYYQIYYNYTDTDIHVGIVVNCGSPSCWAGWGISVRDGLMVGSDAAVGWVNASGSVFIDDFTLQGQLPPDIPCISGNICQDQYFSNECENNVVARSGSRQGNYLIWEFSRPLIASDSCDNAIDPTEQQFIIVSAGPIDFQDEAYGLTYPYFMLQHQWRGSELKTLSSTGTTGTTGETGTTSEANGVFRKSLFFFILFVIVLLV